MLYTHSARRLTLEASTTPAGARSWGCAEAVRATREDPPATRCFERGRGVVSEALACSVLKLSDEWSLQGEVQLDCGTIRSSKSTLHSKIHEILRKTVFTFDHVEVVSDVHVRSCMIYLLSLSYMDTVAIFSRCIICLFFSLLVSRIGQKYNCRETISDLKHAPA